MSPGAAASACPACAGRRVTLKAEGSLAVASSCPACVGDCSSCGGSGWVSAQGANGYDYTRHCTCYGSRARVRALNVAKLPARYAGKLVGDLTQKPGYELSTSQAAAHARVSAWAKDYKKGARGLLLYGAWGTGKTLLLCRALAALVLTRRAPVSVRYVEFALLWDELRDAFDPHREPGAPSAWDLRGPLRDVEVLAIDELGRARSGGEQEEIERLISARYQAGKTTLFATNLSPQGEGSPLEAHLGGRLWSRLGQLVEPVAVEGQDYRRIG